jgi:hypothetical protein
VDHHYFGRSQAVGCAARVTETQLRSDSTLDARQNFGIELMQGVRVELLFFHNESVGVP